MLKRDGFVGSALTVGTLSALITGIFISVGYFFSAYKTIEAVSAKSVEMHRKEETEFAHPGMAKRLDRIEDKIDKILERMGR